MDHVMWGAYLLGQLLHSLKRASVSASSSISGTKSIAAFYKLNWVAISVRLVLMCAAVSYAHGHPDMITKLLSFAGVHLPFDLPFTNSTVVIYGYFGDSTLDWVLSKIPALQKEVPVVKELHMEKASGV